MKVQLNDHSLYKETPEDSTNKDDFHTVEWGIEPNAGFVIGRVLSPVFLTHLGHTVKLEDSAKGGSIIICGANCNINDLTNGSKAHTYAIDSGYRNCNPKWWTSFQPTTYDRVLSNINITKLLPLGSARQRDSKSMLILHNPFTFYFRRHSSFSPHQLMSRSTIWNANIVGAEVLSVIQICSILGYRTLYVAGFENLDNIVINNLKNSIKKLSLYGIKIYDCDNAFKSILEAKSIEEAISNCI